MPTNSVWFGLVEWRLVCFIRCLLVEVTQSPQRLMAGAVGGGRAHDDVVAQFHFQKLAGADEIAGYFDVRLAGRRVPRWVTVHDHDGGSIGDNGGAKYFARMAKDCVQ